MAISNQLRAALTLSKFSLLATLRSPTSVVFSLLFPIIFIVVFGSMVDNVAISMKLTLAPGCDTANPVYQAIQKIPSITLQKNNTLAESEDAIKKGRATAILDIQPETGDAPVPHYSVALKAAGSSQAVLTLLETMIHEATQQIDRQVYPGNPSIASVTLAREHGRAYKQIDFILPGQLGFSLLMAGVFGSSFLLFSLRQNLVLKRLRATPVRKRSIIAGEMLSRLFFHVIGFIIMISLGYFVFGFTLVNGVTTFFEMLLFSLFGLGIFMSIGFIISGMLQNESSITPVANTITLPQILLCGLFFPIESYPLWLQHFCNVLPLTFFVDGLRKIAFEGIHIWQMPFQVGGLLAWTLITGIWSVRAFKWE